jgi:OmpA-OmpF porin, OOP family
MNFMDLVKPYLTQTLMSKAASWLGESESGVGKALSAILPTIMGSILQKSENRGFMDGLGSLLGDSRLTGGNVLDDVGALFGADHAASPLGQMGSSFLGSLFGDKLGGVSQAVSQHAGIGVGSVSKLLGAAAPLVLGLLGKQSAASGGLGALMGLLGGQKAGLMSMIPGAVGGLLGLGGAPASSAQASFSSNTSSVREEEKSGGFPLWIIPLLALLGLGAWWFLKGNEPQVKVVTPDVPAPVIQPVEPAPVVAVEPAPVAVPVVDPALSTPVTTQWGDLGAYAARVLPDQVSINIPANGFETKLLGFVEDASKAVDKTTWFDFDRVLFDTGAATLRPESNEQIANIASILKAFPNVTLKIGGYTDNTGNADANKKLSQARADAVTAAIVAGGIDAARLSAEGYGQEFPVADNATEEGRQKNRRVSARVSAK